VYGIAIFKLRHEFVEVLELGNVVQFVFTIDVRVCLGLELTPLILLEATRLDGDDFSCGLSPMSDRGTAVVAKQVVLSLATGAFHSGIIVHWALMLELVSRPHHHERVRATRLPHAVVAVIMPDKNGLGVAGELGLTTEAVSRDHVEDEESRISVIDGIKVSSR